MTTDITIGGTDVTFQDFNIEVPTSQVDVAPKASVRTTAVESISANDDLVISIDGTPVFKGQTRSGGTKTQTGSADVTAAHPARELFEETVDVSLPSPTTLEVLERALTNSASGGSFTLDYVGSAVTLGNGYDVEDRTVKRVFRDMMDRTSRVWWVDPAGMTIHVEPVGYRGLWQAIDTQGDSAVLERFDSGSVDTVRNAVTVIGTGAEKVTGSAIDTTSIQNYGERPGNSPYKFSWITTETEAETVAQELRVPDPLPEGRLLAGSNVGDVTQPLVNYTVDITDAAKNVSASGLSIEKQTIEQGQARLQVGAGTGTSLEETNRKTKSREDNAPPGSVLTEDRIGNDSISNEKLKDRAVDAAKVAISGIIAENLADSAVERDAIAAAAVNGDKVETGSIGATRLFIEDWIPIGLQFTDNDPAAGGISWNSHSLVFEGTEYPISGGSTGDKYVYWQAGQTSYTTSDTKPDIDGDDALVAINDGGTARQILQATEIHGGAIRTGTITAAEIQAGVITADLIDTLFLTTGTLSVVDEVSGNGIEFQTETTDGGTDTATMRPTSDGLAFIGTDSMRYTRVYTQGLTAEGAVFQLLGGDADIAVTVDGLTSVIRPSNDNAGTVGTAQTAFSAMHAHNFVTASPDEITDVDCGTLGEVDWYDNPPAPVVERARQLGATDDAVPESMDHTPVELGTMANWLLETCKAQQEEITDLEDRVSELEQIVSEKI